MRTKKKRFFFFKRRNHNAPIFFCVDLCESVAAFPLFCLPAARDSRTTCLCAARYVPPMFRYRLCEHFFGISLVRRFRNHVYPYLGRVLGYSYYAPNSCGATYDPKRKRSSAAPPSPRPCRTLSAISLILHSILGQNSAKPQSIITRTGDRRLLSQAGCEAPLFSKDNWKPNGAPMFWIPRCWGRLKKRFALQTKNARTTCVSGRNVYMNPCRRLSYHATPHLYTVAQPNTCQAGYCHEDMAAFFFFFMRFALFDLRPSVHARALDKHVYHHVDNIYNIVYTYMRTFRKQVTSLKCVRSSIEAMRSIGYGRNRVLVRIERLGIFTSCSAANENALRVTPYNTTTGHSSQIFCLYICFDQKRLVLIPTSSGEFLDQLWSLVSSSRPPWYTPSFFPAYG